MDNFETAARKAGAEIIDVIDNDKPGCFHEIITKHFAEIAEVQAQLRAERDALKARVDTRDALINVMAPMHQLTCRNHKICPICKAYDKYSKEIDGESVDTTPGGDE